MWPCSWPGLERCLWIKCCSPAGVEEKPRKRRLRSESILFSRRPANQLEDFGRLAGAEDANTEDFAGHPEGQDGSGDQKNEGPNQVKQGRVGARAVHHGKRRVQRNPGEQTSQRAIRISG